MAVHFEHNFGDDTGIRIVDLPDEKLEREVPVIQMRVFIKDLGTRLIGVQLYDKNTGEFLFDRLVKGVMQPLLKEIGHKCEDCGEYYLQTSPSQKTCSDCKEQD